MAQKLEAIRGGGGSIKVGTTGTISALMSRELESTRSASFSASNGDETSRRPKSSISADEASSSSATGSSKNPENSRRKHHMNGTPRIPMLEASDTSVDGTPIRKKAVKKGFSIAGENRILPNFCFFSPFLTNNSDLRRLILLTSTAPVVTAAVLEGPQLKISG